MSSSPAPTLIPLPAANSLSPVALKETKSAPMTVPAQNDFVIPMQRSCAKSDFSDTLVSGGSYVDNDLGFEIVNGGNSMDDPILVIKMPGEKDQQSIFLRGRYNQNVRKGGMLILSFRRENSGQSH